MSLIIAVHQPSDLQRRTHQLYPGRNAADGRCLSRPRGGPMVEVPQKSLEYNDYLLGLYLS
jgi:hypothetical protein